MNVTQVYVHYKTNQGYYKAAETTYYNVIQWFRPVCINGEYTNMSEMCSLNTFVTA